MSMMSAGGAKTRQAHVGAPLGGIGGGSVASTGMTDQAEYMTAAVAEEDKAATTDYCNSQGKLFYVPPPPPSHFLRAACPSYFSRKFHVIIMIH